MNYVIEKIQTKDLKSTLNLVKEVFDEFDTPYYSQEGVQNFYKFADITNIRKQLYNSMQILVAKKDGKIAGMIAFRDYCHISMLFVDKNYHTQGIGSKLVQEAKFYCTKLNKNLKSITVNSSPYAIEFYHKLGFVDTDKEQKIDGIKFTPMKLYI